MPRRSAYSACSSYDSPVGTSSEEVATAKPADGKAADEASSLAAAQRIRHQAVRLSERMLREVMGSSGDAVSGLQTWQEAAMFRARAEEELEFAREEARRLSATAVAERDAMRSTYASERKVVRAELQRELQSSRTAAVDEAEKIRSAARAEAKAILEQALSNTEAVREGAAKDIDRMERRMAVLQTALADAERRFRRLAATAANEIGTLAAIADQDVASRSEQPTPVRDLHIAEVDLTDEALREAAGEVPQRPVETAGPERDPEVGFYQRRLAGLRDRLEKSGHPPE